MWHVSVYILNKIIPHPYHFDTEKPTPDMWFGAPQNSTTPKNSHTNAHTHAHTSGKLLTIKTVFIC